MESDERYYDAVYDMRALTQDDEDEDENENEAYASALDDDVDDGNDTTMGRDTSSGCDEAWMT